MDAAGGRLNLELRWGPSKVTELREALAAFFAAFRSRYDAPASTEGDAESSELSRIAQALELALRELKGTCLKLFELSENQADHVARTIKRELLRGFPVWIAVAESTPQSFSKSVNSG